jgi:hypothetical protein
MEMVVILQIAVVPAVRGQKWPRVGGIALVGIAALVIGILGRPRDIRPSSGSRCGTDPEVARLLQSPTPEKGRSGERSSDTPTEPRVSVPPQIP